MRINKYVALATGLSRRASDQAIQAGKITINQVVAAIGSDVTDSDTVALDGKTLSLPAASTIIMLNKPVGYVCSRQGQSNPTIYDLLPLEFHSLKPVGRLDKDSSGLILLTNDGRLANELTHPRYTKTKIYQIELNKPLEAPHQKMINGSGIQLEDGFSKLGLVKADEAGLNWQITMSEGRNRQIRRTFAVLNYKVVSLHRIHFGPYALNDLAFGSWTEV